MALSVVASLQRAYPIVQDSTSPRKYILDVWMKTWIKSQFCSHVSVCSDSWTWTTLVSSWEADHTAPLPNEKKTKARMQHNSGPKHNHCEAQLYHPWCNRGFGWKCCQFSGEKYYQRLKSHLGNLPGTFTQHDLALMQFVKTWRRDHGGLTLTPVALCCFFSPNISFLLSSPQHPKLIYKLPWSHPQLGGHWN